jgi:predicted outer membrane repeat protein
VLKSLRDWFRSRQKCVPNRRQPGFRPKLESLEDRLAPAVLTVTSVADNTAADSALTLREAIQVVDGTLGRALTTAEKAFVSGTLGSNDTIQFKLPTGPQKITLTGGALSITKPVAINGPGASLLTISGNSLSRVFYVGQSFSQNLGLNVSMSGLTIASGKDAYGAGLFNSSTLTLNSDTFSSNTATTNGGGGVYNNGALQVNNCTFTNNSTLPNGKSSTSGGGLLNITAGTLTMTGCTFSGNTAPGTGTAGGQGGAVANDGTMSVSNTTISNNSAAFGGGGVYNGTGTLTLTNSTLSGNTVLPNNATPGQGGGLLNEVAATVTITGCTFSANTAQGTGQFAAQGGGIYNSSGTMVVNTSTFTGNSAASDGGGIYTRITNVNNLVTINNSTFTNNNSASDGGGLRAHFGAIVTVNGCTFVGNVASSEGGAIDGSVASKLTILNSTFTGNSAGSIGGAINCGLGIVSYTNDTITGNRVGGIYGGGINIRSTGVTINNTIIAGNFQGTGTTPNNITGYNFSTTTYVADPSSSFNIIGPGGSGGLVNGVNGNQVGVTNLGLGSLANNGGPTQTMALLAGSPAIDRGSNAFVTAGETDQRGLPRIVNGTVDIGAIELQLPPGPPASTLVVTGLPSSTQAGVVSKITVTAESSTGATAYSYTGTIHFTSSDLQAVLPADYTFLAADNGLHTFSVTLKTAGTQAVTVGDTVAASITGTQSVVAVTPAVASMFSVAGFPNPTTAGVPGSFTVAALDPFGNTALSYQGTIHFTSSDPLAGLPADYTFVAGDNGVHSFSATLNTAGLQSLVVTDKAVATITGAHAGITVYPVITGPLLVVNSTADNTTPDNFLTLREALAVVNGTLGRPLTPGEQSQITGTLGLNDAIEFNLPAGPQTINLTGGALSVTQPVAIYGPGAGLLTINGNNADRDFIVGFDYSQNLSLNVSMSGLTISGGSAVVSGKNYGGGLLNFGTLALSNVTFSGNSADSSGGGAIYNDGSLTINNSLISNNTVTSGGPGAGIQNTSSGILNIASTTFTGNLATGGASGGGVANSGQLTIAASTFTGNQADSNGGGIYNSTEGTMTVSTTTVANNFSNSDGGGIDNDGSATITASTLSSNTSASEGGGVASNGILNLTNSTLYGNTATSNGGGLHCSGTSATVTNCTITANRVTSGSSGIFGGGLYTTILAKVFNTIVAGNFQGAAPSTTANDIYGSLDTTSSYNLIGAGGSGGLVNGLNGNQVGVLNLGLGALAYNGGPTQTVALLAGSPAIDQGSNTFVIAGETDQRGLARIANGVVDIGAFEVQ